MASDGAQLRWAFVLLSALAVTAIGGGAVAQEPTPQPGLSATVDSTVPSSFPTAEEVGEVLGVEVGIRGIEPGLSQLWEGIEFDPQELPSAYVGIYRAPPFETTRRRVASTSASPHPRPGFYVVVTVQERESDAWRHDQPLVGRPAWHRSVRA